MKELPQKYDTKATEKRWQDHWLDAKTYRWEAELPREQTYVIDTPPPTVSGHLHMGHVFSYTQADFVARWQRMNGKTVFYPMGFDDNGLPTERLVEKATKKRATDFESREAFIEACMKVSDESRVAYRDLFQSTALSVDWEQEYHTISERSRKISQLSFLDLYHKGHVDRRMEPMLWDPVDQTAIAQAEVEDKELPSHFNDITFRVDGSDETFVIGTTRPELIPACVGVFYHPDDTRYRHLKGKQAVTPLFGVKVPILEDDSVEMDKGTGIMMCCTFGDEKDIEKWRKHKLELRLVLNKYGKIDFKPCQEELTSASDETLEALGNLKAAAARTKILELLAESGDLVESRPITHAVKCAERSGAPLEILPSPQWFVKVIDKKEELKARSAECNWHPEWMAKRMEQWIDGLSWDWCISRQRYFGVPFPVLHAWSASLYPENSNEIHFIAAGSSFRGIIAKPEFMPFNPLDTERWGEVLKAEGYELLPDDSYKFADGFNVHFSTYKFAKKGNQIFVIVPDTDVMDTWATSSVSPQLNSHAISPEYAINADRHAQLYPADLRPQAHEIIRTWAFYTLVKSHLHADSKPWHNLMISGWCLAEDKTKMSKSKGNVVTPIDLIEEHGSDVVRYWASTSKLGQDTAFSRDLLKIGKKLVTKLWNATKFAAIHLEKLDGKPGDITATLDKWILTRLHRTTAKATEEFARYEYASALRAIEDFFWNDFCDNYLELVKKRAYDEADEDKDGQMSAVYTIYHCLDGILRLFAPIVPHVTEELWSHIFDEKYAQTGSIHARGNWPKASDYLVDETAEAEGIAVVDLLEAVRKAKSEKGVSIKWPMSEAIISAQLSESAQADLCGAGNIQSLRMGKGSMTTESGHHTLSLTFAAESDAA